MDPEQYFKDLSAELSAVKNRVQHLIGSSHWASVGAWKESVIKTVVRRYLPPSLTVGSGFIVSPNRVSTQIDLLVCDDSAPFLFRDGDFLVVTADCVRAAVEIKTSISGEKLSDSIRKLAEVGNLLGDRTVFAAPFLGLFCYEPTTTSWGDILGFVEMENGQSSATSISALCFGRDQFLRWWLFDPKIKQRRPYDKWRAYTLEGLAPGYFIQNLIERLFPKAFENAEGIWYPEDGKELHFTMESNPRRI